MTVRIAHRSITMATPIQEETGPASAIIRQVDSNARHAYSICGLQVATESSDRDDHNEHWR